MAEDEKSISIAKKKHRSPSYPVVPIDEAIERVGQIYRKDKRAFTTFEAIVEHMGYGSKTKGGRSGRMVAAMRQYGLLDERGGQFRVSDLAFRILETPEDSPEHAQAVKEASLNPPIFRRILNYYEGELPSDAALRSHLIFKMEFNTDTVPEFIRIFRRTIEIANPSPGDYNAVEESEGVEKESLTRGKPMQQQPSSPPISQGQGAPTRLQTPVSQLQFPFYLSKDQKAILYVPATMNQREYDLLKKQIENSLTVIEATAVITDEEPKRAQPYPCPATWHNKDTDQTVTVIGDAGTGPDGRRYLRIAGSDTSIPADEVKFTQ